MIDARFQFVVPGYSHIRLAPGTSALVINGCSGGIRDILAQGSLYDYAAQHPEKQEMKGRAPVYRIPLPWCNIEVVVRRNRRGGLLRHLLDDQFFITTRAIRELDNALFLRENGVPTPDVVALVTYRSGMVRRADIATRYIPGSADLARAYADAAPDKRAYMLDAVAELLKLLASKGIYHPDLNAKNIVLVPTSQEDDYQAHVLDVDRVHLNQAPGTVHELNLHRLVRSLQKYRWPAEAIDYLQQQVNG